MPYIQAIEITNNYHSQVQYTSLERYTRIFKAIDLSIGHMHLSLLLNVLGTQQTELDALTIKF